MLGTTNGDVLGGFGTSSTYRKGGIFDAQQWCLSLVLSRQSSSAVLPGSKKWQNASKLVSVVLIIAGAGLAFIALVGGNGGPRWSGLVKSSTCVHCILTPHHREGSYLGTS